MKHVTTVHKDGGIVYEWVDYDFRELNLNHIHSYETFSKWLYQIEIHKLENPYCSYFINGYATNDHDNGYLQICARSPATEKDFLAQEKRRKDEEHTRLEAAFLKSKAELEAFVNES